MNAYLYRIAEGLQGQEMFDELVDIMLEKAEEE